MLQPHRKLRYRRVGRRAQGTAIADIETCPVQDAFDAGVRRIEVAGGQFEVLMAALVFQGIEIAVVVEDLKARGLEVATGRFGALMHIDIQADGPFTVLVEA